MYYTIVHDSEKQYVPLTANSASPEPAGYRHVSSIKCERATKIFSNASKPRPAENTRSIVPHYARFHASARARSGFPCASRNAPRRKGGPAKMAMARWPMAALLSGVAPMRGLPYGWQRPGRLCVMSSPDQSSTGLTPVSYDLRAQLSSLPETETVVGLA